MMMMMMIIIIINNNNKWYLDTLYQAKLIVAFTTIDMHIKIVVKVNSSTNTRHVQQFKL